MAGITAMNGRPSIRAKYASETAVEPEDASTTVVRGPIQPLQSAYRKSERASRCLSEPVGCDDSSLRYRSMPHCGGSGNGSRWVSAERFASASTAVIASVTQARSVVVAPVDAVHGSRLLARVDAGLRPVLPLGRERDGGAGGGDPGVRLSRTISCSSSAIVPTRTFSWNDSTPARK